MKENDDNEQWFLLFLDKWICAIIFVHLKLTSRGGMGLHNGTLLVVLNFGSKKKKRILVELIFIV